MEKNPEGASEKNMKTFSRSFVINLSSSRESSKKFFLDFLTQNLAFNLSGALFFLGLGCSLKWWYKDQLLMALLKQNLPAFSEPQQTISWETGEYFTREAHNVEEIEEIEENNSQQSSNIEISCDSDYKKREKTFHHINKTHSLYDRVDLYSNSLLFKFKSPWQKHAYHRYLGLFPERSLSTSGSGFNLDPLASKTMDHGKNRFPSHLFLDSLNGGSSRSQIPELMSAKSGTGVLRKIKDRGEKSLKYTFWEPLPCKNWFQLSARGLCLLPSLQPLQLKNTTGFCDLDMEFMGGTHRPRIRTFLKEPIKQTGFSLSSDCDPGKVNQRKSQKKSFQFNASKAFKGFRFADETESSRHFSQKQGRKDVSSLELRDKESVSPSSLFLNLRSVLLNQSHDQTIYCKSNTNFFQRFFGKKLVNYLPTSFLGNYSIEQSDSLVLKTGLAELNSWYLDDGDSKDLTTVDFPCVDNFFVVDQSVYEKNEENKNTFLFSKKSFKKSQVKDVGTLSYPLDLTGTMAGWQPPIKTIILSSYLDEIPYKLQATLSSLLSTLKEKNTTESWDLSFPEPGKGQDQEGLSKRLEILLLDLYNDFLLDLSRDKETQKYPIKKFFDCSKVGLHSIDSLENNDLSPSLISADEQKPIEKESPANLFLSNSGDSTSCFVDWPKKQLIETYEGSHIGFNRLVDHGSFFSSILPQKILENRLENRSLPYEINQDIDQSIESKQIIVTPYDELLDQSIEQKESKENSELLLEKQKRLADTINGHRRSFKIKRSKNKETHHLSNPEESNLKEIDRPLKGVNKLKGGSNSLKTTYNGKKEQNEKKKISYPPSWNENNRSETFLRKSQYMEVKDLLKNELQILVNASLDKVVQDSKSNSRFSTFKKDQSLDPKELDLKNQDSLFQELDHLSSKDDQRSLEKKMIQLVRVVLDKLLLEKENQKILESRPFFIQGSVPKLSLKPLKKSSDSLLLVKNLDITFNNFTPLEIPPILSPINKNISIDWLNKFKTFYSISKTENQQQQVSGVDFSCPNSKDVDNQKILQKNSTPSSKKSTSTLSTTPTSSTLSKEHESGRSILKVKTINRNNFQEDQKSRIYKIILDQRVNLRKKMDLINPVDNRVNVTKKRPRFMSGYIYPDMESTSLESNLTRWLQWQKLGFVQKKSFQFSKVSPVNSVNKDFKKAQTLETLKSCFPFQGFFINLNDPIHKAQVSPLMRLMDKACLVAAEIPRVGTRSQTCSMASTKPLLLCEPVYGAKEKQRENKTKDFQSTVPLLQKKVEINRIDRELDGKISLFFEIKTSPFYVFPTTVEFSSLDNRYGNIDQSHRFLDVHNADFKGTKKKIKSNPILEDQENDQSFTYPLSVDKVNPSMIVEKGIRFSKLFSHNVEEKEEKNPQKIQINGNPVTSFSHDKVVSEKADLWEFDLRLACFPGFTKPDQLVDLSLIDSGLEPCKTNSLEKKERNISTTPSFFSNDSSSKKRLRKNISNNIMECSPRKIAYQGIVAQRDKKTKDFQSTISFNKLTETQNRAVAQINNEIGETLEPEIYKVIALDSILGTALFGPENPLTDRQSHFFGQRRVPLATLTYKSNLDYIRQLGKEVLAQSNPKGLAEKSVFGTEREKLLSFSTEINSFSFKKRNYTYLLEESDQWHLVFQEQLRTALKDAKKYPPSSDMVLRDFLETKTTASQSKGRIQVSAPLILAHQPKGMGTHRIVNQLAEQRVSAPLAPVENSMKSFLPPTDDLVTLRGVEPVGTAETVIPTETRSKVKAIKKFIGNSNNCYKINKVDQKFLIDLNFSSKGRKFLSLENDLEVKGRNSLEHCHYPPYTERDSFELFLGNHIDLHVDSNRSVNLHFLQEFRQYFEPLNVNSWFIISQWSFLVYLFTMVEQILSDKIGPALFTLEQLLSGATSSRSNRTHVVRVSKSDRPKFKDIAGVDGLLGELAELVLFLRGHKERLWSYGKKKSVLLTGPPGTGKTFLVRALANEAKVPVLILSAGTLTASKTNGNKPSWSIRHAFRRAKQLAPCILFIDEIDALGRSRGDGLLSNADMNEIVANTDFSKKLYLLEKRSKFSHISTPAWQKENKEMGSLSLHRANLEALNKSNNFNSHNKDQVGRGYGLIADKTVRQTGETDGGFGGFSKNENKVEKTKKERKFGPLTQLLVSMDGVSTLSGVLIMGATNRPESLDPALTRPGRFERIMQVEKPGEQKRIEILQLYSRKLGIDGGNGQIPWSYLANRTVGLTAADLAVAMNYSSLKAILQESKHTIETIEYGLDSIVRSSNKFFSNKNEIKDKGQETKNTGKLPSLLTAPFTVNRIAKDYSNRLESFSRQKNFRHMQRVRETAYYQAGKILVQTLLPLHPPVALIRLDSSGNTSATSADTHVPTDGFLQQVSSLESRLIGLYGGKAASLLLDISTITGASRNFPMDSINSQDKVKYYEIFCRKSGKNLLLTRKEHIFQSNIGTQEIQRATQLAATLARLFGDLYSQDSLQLINQSFNDHNLLRKERSNDNRGKKKILSFQRPTLAQVKSKSLLDKIDGKKTTVSLLSQDPSSSPKVSTQENTKASLGYLTNPTRKFLNLNTMKGKNFSSYSYSNRRISLSRSPMSMNQFLGPTNAFQLVKPLEFSMAQRDRSYPGWFRLYLPDMEGTEFMKNLVNQYFSLGLQTLTRPSLNEFTPLFLEICDVPAILVDRENNQEAKSKIYQQQAPLTPFLESSFPFYEPKKRVYLENVFSENLSFSRKVDEKTRNLFLCSNNNNLSIGLGLLRSAAKRRIQLNIKSQSKIENISGKISYPHVSKAFWGFSKPWNMNRLISIGSYSTLLNMNQLESKPLKTITNSKRNHRLDYLGYFNKSILTYHSSLFALRKSKKKRKESPTIEAQSGLGSSTFSRLPDMNHLDFASIHYPDSTHMIKSIKNLSLLLFLEKQNFAASYGDVSQMEKELIYHSLVHNSFAKAFLLIDQNRQLTDYFADYLIRFQVLRQDQILHLFSTVLLSCKKHVFSSAKKNIDKEKKFKI